MANRRMFSMTIIDTDAFLEMPDSSQVLYFHLAMRADDDGFISSPKRIARMIGASDDDLKLLVMKEFIIPFESGVCVIRHWRLHNYIRKDRYTPTFHKFEKSLIGLTENDSYTVNPNEIVERLPDEKKDEKKTGDERLPSGRPTVDQASYQRLPQDRLGKDRLGKETHTNMRARASKPSLADFDEFWEKYPNKIMQEQSASLWLSINPDETRVKEIMDGLNRWLASDQWERGIYQSPVNWLRDKRWIDQPPKAVPKKEQAGAHHYEDEQLQELIARKMAKQRAAKT